MTEQPKDVARDAMAAILGPIQDSACEFKQVPAGSLAQYAATPEGRKKLLATRARYFAYRNLLAAAVRDLADVDRIMDRALRKSRWGIRA